jgi:hypothetical protein
MINIKIDINQARAARYRMQQAAEFFSANEKAFSEFGDSLNWEDLENLPNWLFWKKKEISHFVLTVGTIFLLPSVRMWIDAKRIQKIRYLIGENVFEYILTHTPLDNKQNHSFNVTDVEASLLSAGAAVIISSHSLRLRPWLLRILPSPQGKLEQKLAIQILQHALRVLEQTSSQSTEEIKQ